MHTDVHEVTGVHRCSSALRGSCGVELCTQSLRSRGAGDLPNDSRVGVSVPEVIVYRACLGLSAWSQQGEGSCFVFKWKMQD